MDLLEQTELLGNLDIHIAESDEKMIKLMLKTFNVKNSLINTNPEQKNAKKSIEKMNVATKLFRLLYVQKCLCSSAIFELLTLYGKAIAYASNDSIELARAYANRSAILYNARLYEDSLKDINRAMVLDYPDNLKAKLFARKAKCLLALGPKYRRKAKKAIAEARRWMEKVNDADKNDQKSQLKKLSKQTSFEPPFEKPDNSCIVPDIVDPNEQLIGASKAIELKYSEKFGRHFVATRDIKPGEILIKQKAYLWTLPEKLYYAHCWNCSKRAWASVPCKNCVNVVFCDENCRDEAWINFHDVECPTITKLLIEKLCNMEIMGIRLTIKALKEAGSIALLREKLETIDLISDPFTRGFTEGKLDGSKYASIYTLAINTSSKRKCCILKRNLRMCVDVLFAWANATEIFGKKIDNPNELATNESVIFMGKLYMRNVNICANNPYEGNYYQQELTTDTQYLNGGFLLSCLTSYFNHSCDSNAYVVHSGDVMGIRSVQSVKKNEQLFVSYGESYVNSPTTDRRNKLKVKFDFWCECHACKGDWGPYSVWPSLMDQPPTLHVSYKVERALMRFNEDLDKEFDKIKSLFTDRRYIPILSQLLDTLYKNVNYPCKEICEYIYMLKHNFLSNSY